MGDKSKGLYGKFRVARTDGRDLPGLKHDGCEYFVLDLTHDPHAAPAIRAYVASCRTEYPLLAQDLEKILAWLPNDTQNKKHPPRDRPATRFEVKYEGGHSHQEGWEKTDSYCPACGARQVWHETGDADYYVGEQFMCLACGASGNMWAGDDRRSYNWQDRQRFEALTKAEATNS